jgi:hypothetical protein
MTFYCTYSKESGTYCQKQAVHTKLQTGMQPTLTIQNLQLTNILAIWLSSTSAKAIFLGASWPIDFISCSFNLITLSCLFRVTRYRIGFFELAGTNVTPNEKSKKNH